MIESKSDFNRIVINDDEMKIGFYEVLEQSSFVLARRDMVVSTERLGLCVYTAGIVTSNNSILEKTFLFRKKGLIK